MAELQMPSSVTIEEKPAMQMNAYAALYLALALVWLFFFYTEITGIWRIAPELEKVVEAQRVPVEKPGEENTDGRTDES